MLVCRNLQVRWGHPGNPAWRGSPPQGPPRTGRGPHLSELLGLYASGPSPVGQNKLKYNRWGRLAQDLQLYSFTFSSLTSSGLVVGGFSMATRQSIWRRWFCMTSLHPETRTGIRLCCDWDYIFRGFASVYLYRILTGLYQSYQSILHGPECQTAPWRWEPHKRHCSCSRWVQRCDYQTWKDEEF